MVERENAVILTSVAVAIVAAYLVKTYADPPSWGSLAVLIGLGVVVPTLANDFLDRHAGG